MTLSEHELSAIEHDCVPGHQPQLFWILVHCKQDFIFWHSKQVELVARELAQFPVPFLVQVFESKHHSQTPKQHKNKNQIIDMK